MNFAESVKLHELDTKTTENGAMAYSTINNPLIDMFAQLGALRCRAEQEIATKFANAFALDPLLATKMLFYCGDIRCGGLGERRTFRICLKWLATYHPNVVRLNMGLIPFFNRWDSLFVLVDTPVENDMWTMVSQQLNMDMEAYLEAKATNTHKPISLAAKWMPTETASSKETRRLARIAMRKLGVTPREYRKMLSALRAYLNVVERSMSANEWDEIEYAAVPSYAMKNYRRAFGRHDEEGFAAYIASVVEGKSKINASTLFPYDLICEYWRNPLGGIDATVEAQWKALPNYLTQPTNILVMADVSGSMTGRPMETSIGLATYFAQRNTGAYHNLYMTFSNEPHFIGLRDDMTLWECYRKVATTGVGYNTNLEKAFMKILDHAVVNGIAKEEMPAALVVISDMEIDRYIQCHGLDFYNTMKIRFKAQGYECPKLVCWNVEARNDTFLSKHPDVLCVSGQSASTFALLCANLEGKTAWDLMLDALNSPVYDCVACE